MAVMKGLAPEEAKRCAAETESIVWAMIVIMVGLIGLGGFLFIASLSGNFL